MHARGVAEPTAELAAAQGYRTAWVLAVVLPVPLAVTSRMWRGSAGSADPPAGYLVLARANDLLVPLAGVGFAFALARFQRRARQRRRRCARCAPSARPPWARSW